MKRLLAALVVAFTLLAGTASAQITVTNTFTPNTRIESAKVNENFNDLATDALNRTGGTITGNIAVDALVTIDGYDISVIGAQVAAAFTNGLTIGGNNIINSSGKIPAINSTYFASLDGSALTGLATGDVTAAGSNTFTGTNLFSSTAPTIRFTETDQASGSTSWRFLFNGATFFLQSMADDYASGTTLITSDRSGNTTVAGSIKERGRSTALGEWTSVAYAGGNFTADSGTWTVGAGDQTAFKYTVIGKTLIMSVVLDSTTVAASSTTQLRVAVPGSFTIGSTTKTLGLCYQSGLAGSVCEVTATSGNTYVSIVQYNQTNGAAYSWQSGTDNINVHFQISIEVQ